ncbi:hypothetical protein CEXT_10371 [Caerostris extrusa]|uniref:Uncharacterized protein n=1 Tax=Caerostris extrusa TaxID=172846 RepID=A0AAV4RNC7_CAEEX|nr:hypothetical protein CEXT_10371 [Caerostris extrusa]
MTRKILTWTFVLEEYKTWYMSKCRTMMQNTEREGIPSQLMEKLFEGLVEVIEITTPEGKVLPSYNPKE